MRIHNIISLVILVFQASTIHAQGALAYDPFNQNLGQLNGTASSGVPWTTGSTWGPAFGNGGTVVAGSLTYGSLSVSGNKSQFPWFAGDNASIRSLGANRGGAPADFWISFLATPNQPGQGLYLYFSNLQQMLIGAPTTGGGLGMQLNASVTNTTQQSFNVSPTISADGSTHFFATHFQLGTAGTTNTITLYVDPDFSSLATGLAPTGGSTTTFGAALPFLIERLLVGNFSGVTGASGTFTLDEIRLGATWTSVSPVPEPSTIILMVSTAAAGCYLWRRRVHQLQQARQALVPESVE